MKPRKVKATITRTITEIAIVYLDRQGNIEDFEPLDELDTVDVELGNIHSIISEHSE
jgi:hypothetical protein